MSEIDRLIHEPARLRILTLLSSVKEADFSFILRLLRLTNGNLSVHMRKLEEAGYVSVAKEFVGRTPRTTYAITEAGGKALQSYWTAMEQLRKQAKK